MDNIDVLNMDKLLFSPAGISNIPETFVNGKRNMIRTHKSGYAKFATKNNKYEK